VDSVEDVCFITPELGHPGCYWVINQTDRCLWHERYHNTETGEEGDLDCIEPDVFKVAPGVAEDSSSEGSESSDSSSDGESSVAVSDGDENVDDEILQSLHEELPELF